MAKTCGYPVQRRCPAVSRVTANAGACPAKLRAARVRVRGSVGLRSASDAARSSRPASLAAANHFPSAPGPLAIRSRRMPAAVRSGYFFHNGAERREMRGAFKRAPYRRPAPPRNLSSPYPLPRSAPAAVAVPPCAAGVEHGRPLPHGLSALLSADCPKSAHTAQFAAEDWRVRWSVCSSPVAQIQHSAPASARRLCARASCCPASRSCI
jgi:hypothetical protein